MSSNVGADAAPVVTAGSLVNEVKKREELRRKLRREISIPASGEVQSPFPPYNYSRICVS